MMGDLQGAAGRVGLKMHMGKTKVLSNVQDRDDGGDWDRLDVEGNAVQILGYGEGTTYLGRCLCMENPHMQEIKHRASKAWGKFWSLKSLLCTKAYLLHQRLKLFE